MKRREFLIKTSVGLGILSGVSFCVEHYINEEKQKQIKYIIDSINEINKHLENVKILLNENKKLEEKFFEKQGFDVHLYELNGERFAYINNTKISQDIRLCSFLMDLGRLIKLYSITDFSELSAITSSNDFICKKITENLSRLLEEKPLNYGVSIPIPRIMVSMPTKNPIKIINSEKLKYTDFCVLLLREQIKYFKNKNFVQKFGLIMQQVDNCPEVLAFLFYDDEPYQVFNTLTNGTPAWRLKFGYDRDKKAYVKTNVETHFNSYKGRIYSLETNRYFERAIELLSQFIDLDKINRVVYNEFYLDVLDKYLNSYEELLNNIMSEIIEIAKEPIKKRQSGTIFVFA